MAQSGKFSVVLIVLLIVSCASPKKPIYEWKHSFMGGGGFITGLLTDVADTSILCADPHYENTFYLGEWTEGIFKTNDGGASWTDISGNLPFKTDSVNTLVDIKCDPDRADIIYAGFIKAGLWVSENGGKTWLKLYPENNVPFNASSMVIGGVTDDEIYVACEPLYYSPCLSAVLFSSDRGKTFTDVFDHTLGAVRWKGIAVDKLTGTIVGVSCGSGCYYANRVNK